MIDYKPHAPEKPYYLAYGYNTYYRCQAEKPHLSIKCMFNGPGVYEIEDGGRFIVDDNTYLILNDQQSYSLVKEGEIPIESFCAFFETGWAHDILHSLITSDIQLLDNPVIGYGQPIHFFEKLTGHDELVTPHIQAIRSSIKTGPVHKSWLEEKLHALLAGMIQS